MREISWEEIYELAKKYYAEYGNLEIPYTYCVNYNGSSVCLGAWIKKQSELNRHNKLSDLQVSLLEEIGMKWYKNKAKHKKRIFSWEDKYKLAKKYYEENGDLLIPHTYVINYRNKKINLGTWISTQRTKYNKKNISELDSVKIKLLDEIGMIWNVIQYKNIDKYLKKQYMLYEQNELNEDEIVKLLEDGAFAYGDSDEILKANTLEFYRKKIMNK